MLSLFFRCSCLRCSSALVQPSPVAADYLPTSILLVLSPHAPSPALPLFESKIQRKLLDRDNSHLTPLLHPLFFRSVDCASGDIILFKQSVPHFDSANKQTEDSVILHSQLTDTSEELCATQGGKQMYVWQIMEKMFEQQSPEYIASLINNAKHQPLAHYSFSKDAKKQAAERSQLDKQIKQTADKIIDDIIKQ